MRAGLVDEASKLLEEGVELARRDQAGQPVLAALLASLGLVRGQQERGAESLELLKESDALFAATEGSKSRNSLQARVNLARRLRESESPVRAADVARAALAATEGVPDVADKRLELQGILGISLTQTREFDEARTVLETAIAEHDSAEASAGIATLVHGLGSLHYYTGKFDEARERLQTALEMRLALPSPYTDDLAKSYNALAAVARDTGDTQGALEFMVKAEAVLTALHGPESLQVATYEYNRARMLLQAGDLDAAETVANHALKVRTAQFGNDSFRTAECLELMGEIALARGDTQAAVKALTDALRIFDVTLGRPDPNTIQARFRLLQSFMAAKRIDEARTMATELTLAAKSSKQMSPNQAQAIAALLAQFEKLQSTTPADSAVPARKHGNDLK